MFIRYVVGLDQKASDYSMRIQVHIDDVLHIVIQHNVKIDVLIVLIKVFN